MISYVYNRYVDISPLAGLVMGMLLGSLPLPFYGQVVENAERQALRYIRNYDPEGYDILKAYYKAPVEYEFEQVNISLSDQADIRKYIDSSNQEVFMNSLNTVVHESCHGYTHHTVFRVLEKQNIPFEWGEHYSLFYIDKSEQMLVKHTNTFPSAELHGSLPDSLITSRYHTYIYPSSAISTQTIGIYGLLDEWHAYYHGTKNSVNQFPYYEIYAKNDYERWAAYFTGVHGTYLAYPEFKLYILHYLIQAEQNAPEVYEAILANDAFRDTFRRIDRLFGNLLDQYTQLKTKTLQDLMMAGVNCGEDEEFVFLGPMGYGNFRLTFDRLMLALETPHYRAMWERLTE